MKRLEFFVEHDQSLPHFSKHDVFNEEVYEFFRSGILVRRERKDGSSVGYGRLESGRYLEVIFREFSDRIFVVTAYDLTDKEIISIVEGRRNHEDY